MKLRPLAIASLLSLSSIVLFSSCNKDDDDGDNDPSSNPDISTIADKFYSSTVTVDVGDEYVTFTTKNEPDHKSMYYQTNNALYESYDEPSNSDFFKNPNFISQQNFVFRIPRYPSQASGTQAAEASGLGITVNGIVMFNQFAAPGDDIFEEENSFDQYEGHPQNTGVYHYHSEPTWITSELGSDALVGVLLDGFPIYGPVENGVSVTNDDLDEFHGHSHATAEFPDGIYHYHVTDEYPWLNGDGYYGTKGTVTK